MLGKQCGTSLNREYFFLVQIRVIKCTKGDNLNIVQRQKSLANNGQELKIAGIQLALPRNQMCWENRRLLGSALECNVVL